MTRESLAQVVRFAVVGGVNTGTYYGSYLLLCFFMPYLAAQVVAFALSTIGSFLLNCYFTYRTPPTWRKFLLFPLTVATNFVVTTVGVAGLVELLGVDERIAPLLAAAVAIPFTFLATRYVLTASDSAAPTRARNSRHRRWVRRRPSWAAARLELPGDNTGA